MSHKKEPIPVDEAKNAINGILSGMGHDPYGLIINKIDANYKTSYWLVEGEFQKGFMGDVMNFRCEYEYDLQSTQKMEVTSGTRRE